MKERSNIDNENAYEVDDRTALGARPKIRGNTIDIRSKVCYDFVIISNKKYDFSSFNMIDSDGHFSIDILTKTSSRCPNGTRRQKRR